MKRQSRILAGTAIGLFMASAPLGAMPMVETAASGRALPLIRVQVECQEGESAEACAARGGQEAAPEQPRRKKRQAEEQQQQEQAAPEAEPQPQQAEEPQPRRKQKRQVEEQQQEQPAIQAEPQPQQAEEPQPRRKQKRQVEEQQQEQPAIQAEPQPQQAEEPQPSRKLKRKVEEQQQQATPEAEPQPQQAEEPQPSRKLKRKVEEQQQEQPAIQAEPQPQAEEPAKQAEEPAKQGEEPVKKRKLRAQEQTPAEQPAEQAEKPAEATPLPTTPEAPAGEAPAQAEKPAEPGAEQPVQAEKPAEGEQKPVQQGEAPVNPNEAPLLDSQKEAPPAQAGGEQPAQQGKPLRKLKPGQQPAQQEQPAEQTAQPQPAPVDLGPPPTDDRQAQEAAQPVEIKPVTAEQGTRLERAPEIDLRRRPRPEGTEVVREIGDRLIVEINNQIIVESNDRPRLTRNAQDVYYEELPGGRTREVIIRDNGNQIITIRNRYGDIVRRSRITPDGREYVLTYVDDRYYEEMDEWRDPGLDLPPLELHIPRDEYILEAEYVDDPEAYYDFLEQPPVERVKRLYSVDEVKRSARVRDIARRIDLDTLTFEFGSASIPESEVTKLEGVANAMERMLKKNPAETFLIEGHTDAVGSDVANLALSDRRAEAVADALTNVFGIPPENLSTQGYGERYLKVKTQSPERENRRVAIRRITPLVAPVASAN